MIEVPERVKDALREGIYKKEYRFVVSYTRDIIAYTFESTSDIITIEESGDYQWVAGGVPGVIGEYEVSSGGRPSGGGDIVNGATISLQSGDMISTYAMDITPINLKSGEEEVSFTIDNDTLVKESVHIDERVCSGDRLKFGLCEGTSLEFQYFDHPNIKGNRIQAFIDVQYKDGDGTLKWHTIPMGFFDVDECSMQFSTGIRKATAYNKLKSDYLDAKANEAVEEIIAQGEYGYTNKVSIYTILKKLLNGYGIEEETYNYIEPQLGRYQSSNLTEIPICDDSGRSTGYNVYLYMIEVGFDLNADDFYKFDVYTSTLKEHAKNYVWNNYKSYTTNIDGTIYTLEQLANTAYAESFDLCGEAALRKKVNVNTYFFTRKGGQADLYTNDYSECRQLCFSVPVNVTVDTSPPYISPELWRDYFNQRWGEDYSFCKIYQKDLSDAQKMRLTSSEMENISDVTLRELQSAVYETVCQYGKLDRETDLFSGVELNGSRLLPADDLYPDNVLLPYGGAEGSFKSQYKKLWFDEGGMQKFRYLIITYKGTEIEDGNEHEVEKTLQRTVNTDGTVDYNMSDNWLFRNLVWTDEQVGEYADAMVLKMKNITWFPFEMWAAGLPYLEAGDEIEINAHDQTYTSYILNRQLRGIQNLEDTFVNGQLDIF